MSLDGKTGSKIVNLDGKSDSNNITLVGGSNISVIDYPTDTYTINAVATGCQYLNPDKNFVIDNLSGTINLSTTIYVSNISANEITSGLAIMHGTEFARFGNINRLNEPAICQTNGGVVTINSYANYIY